MKRMNAVLEFFGLLTSLVMSLVLSLAILIPPAEAAAGIGGSGGGPRSIQTVTVKVCGGESGVECQMVTYEVDAKAVAKPVECKVLSGEEGSLVPCTERYGVPAWLQRLSSVYGGKVVQASKTTGDTGP